MENRTNFDVSRRDEEEDGLIGVMAHAEEMQAAKRQKLEDGQSAWRDEEEGLIGVVAHAEEGHAAKRQKVEEGQSAGRDEEEELIGVMVHAEDDEGAGHAAKRQKLEDGQSAGSSKSGGEQHRTFERRKTAVRKYVVYDDDSDDDDAPLSSVKKEKEKSEEEQKEEANNDHEPHVQNNSSVGDESDKSVANSEDCNPLAQRKPLVTYQRKAEAEQGVRKEVSQSEDSAPGSASTSIDGGDDDDDVPIAHRSSIVNQVVVAMASSSAWGSTGKSAKKILKKLKKMKVMKVTKRTKKVEVEGVKWHTLEHNGVIFPPPYEPHGVKMLYDGRPVYLTPEQEEVATMFAVMKDTEYATKRRFLKNFWDDWKPYLGKSHVIKRLELCDFTPIYEYCAREKERKKSLTAEQKRRLKEEKMRLEEKYMWATVDGVKEKVGNFRVEPPGLFRGRGDHPKMGKLKRRILPHDIVINIGIGARVPACPIPGQKWKEVRHDNFVTWLAYWNDPISNKDFKYVFLAPSSTLKGQSDMQKYEKARTLKDYIDDIRKTYTKDFRSSDPTKQQIAVATYLIDRLALRAGNEKDEDEADTVGCCSLKVEHVSLVAPRSLQFDFLGKDSIRYFNTVEVEEMVYKAIGHFKKGKKEGADLFDKLDTTKLNLHLKEIMPSLTAKVFRTYNASVTLDTLLRDTDGDTTIELIAEYQLANKEVAILCNHQRSVSKGHSAQMERLERRVAELQELLEELETDLERAKKGKPPLKDKDGKAKRNQNPEALEKKIAAIKQKIDKMRLNMSVKDDLKTVALGTSKINYMDPRITVAWCKHHDVPIEKIFNKSLLSKFAWAMDVHPSFRF